MWIVEFAQSLDGWQRFNAGTILAATGFIVGIGILVLVRK